LSGGELISEKLGLNVKLLYSSIVAYQLNIVGGIFSIFYITILARALTVEEYGIWVMIIRYIGYFAIPSVVFTYWLPRDISRGKNTSKTGLVYSLAMGAILTPVYIAFVWGASSELEQPLLPLLLSSSIIILEYLNAALMYTSQGHAPQIVGFGQFAFKAGQAISGIIMISGIHLGLTGAVLSVLFGRLCMDLLMLRQNLPILRKSRLNPQTAITWAKSSWRSLFGSLTCLVFWLDVLIVSLIFGSEVPVAYYGICITILTVITYASSIPSALYPKVLAKRNLEDMGEAIWLTLVITIPIAAFIILYAEPICAILGTKYLPAAVPLRVFSVASVLQVVSGIAVISYLGLEGKDSSTLTQRELLRSTIFKNDLVNMAINIVYIGGISISAYYLSDPVAVASSWGAWMCISFVISLAVLGMLISRDFAQKFPFLVLGRDSLLLTLPAAPLAAMPLLFPVDAFSTLWLLVPVLVAHIVAFFLAYVGILYLVSKRFRKTLNDARVEIWGALRGAFGRNGGGAAVQGEGGTPQEPPKEQ